MSVLADALQAAQARAAAAVGKAFVAGRITRDQADTELDRQTEKEERWGLWVWEELDEGGRT